MRGDILQDLEPWPRAVWGQGGLQRHRHRYEFNNSYRNLFLESGYVVSSTSPDGRLVELIELKGHPFLRPASTTPNSSPSRQPHPLFRLIKAAQQRLPDSPAQALRQGTLRSHEPHRWLTPSVSQWWKRSIPCR